ncbi:dynamin family protein [Deltaproteobacteria bacterium TL4]
MSLFNMNPDESTESPEEEGIGTENRYLQKTSEGMKLVAKLVSVGEKRGKTDELMLEMNRLIEEKFLTLSKDDEAPGGADTYADLQKAYDDLEALVSFPQFENHTIVAVGGCFSSGKSCFLNSLLEETNLLPSDTTPTTSIPTYIMAGNEDAFYALNKHQNKVVIDRDALDAITHQFLTHYKVSFSHILRILTVERKNFKHPNLMFLDTPGYSKSDHLKRKEDNTDENIAREHLRNADFLIWLMDIQNGTVPQTDIEFIKSLQFKKPILFIFNKADKKPAKDVTNIIEVASKNLSKQEIQVYDVIGYSSNEIREYSPQGKAQDQRLLEALESAVSVSDKGELTSPLFISSMCYNIARHFHSLNEESTF